MPKYLIEANYTPEGMKGILAKGGIARREAVEKMLSDLGGTLESFNFAFGETDAYVVVEVPDNIAAAAVGMLVGASGMVACRTTVLLTPEEIDRAAAVNASYTPPGQT
jgi:uncharacterized protein with GYD domain